MMVLKQSGGYHGELRFNEPMSKHTTWRVGGPADQYYLPLDIDDLTRFIETLPVNEPLTWVGLGSNVLVRDAGIRGTVIATSGLLNNLEQTDVNSVRVESGVACAKVARFTAKLGFTGAEFLAGIPGTMGGALAMNAGAFGGETWNIVKQVEVLQRHGSRVMRLPSEYKIGYRTVVGNSEEWFISAILQMDVGAKSQDHQLGMGKIRSLLARRNESQPTQQPNAGSVFRNPDGDFSARLIEACHLKGYKIGGACVSEKHANFIVNLGTATAADIEQLIHYVQTTVEEKQGVRLIPEVRIMGDTL